MTPRQRTAPIGVFDSGVGGLTVLRDLRERLPNERFVYLGDTARVPYGTKSAETVATYARNVANVLAERGCKALVIACNTASAYGLEAVRQDFDGPVIDVIAPVAVRVSHLRTVGVLGTRGTVKSAAYVRAIHENAPTVKVVQQACPLLVPLAEEGWTAGEVPERVLDRYLADLLRDGIDGLILGCTHYPLLRAEIDRAVARHSATPVEVFTSGESTSSALVDVLDRHDLRASSTAGGVRYLVSDDPEGFAAVSARFLGESVQDVEHVHVR